MILPARMSGAEKRERMAIMEAAISSTMAHPNIVQVGSPLVEGGFRGPGQKGVSGAQGKRGLQGRAQGQHHNGTKRRQLFQLAVHNIVVVVLVAASVAVKTSLGRSKVLL